MVTDHVRMASLLRDTIPRVALPVVPEYGHESKYEVRLVERSPHAVDANEQSRGILFVDKKERPRVP